jgi:UDPglucose 6-dehydrogenase
VKVGIFGAGYVGLSLGATLAQQHSVILIDKDPLKVSKINDRISPLKEYDLEKFLQNAHLDLSATEFDAESLLFFDLIILALPTNFDEAQQSFDTSILETTLSKIAKVSKAIPIIIRSTVPIGFSDKCKKKYEFETLFHSPEFLRESKSLYDNLNPSRIIVGSKCRVASNFVNALIDCSNLDNVNVIQTDNRSAEVIKLASNAYLAMRVSFFNEIDTIAHKLNLDSHELINGICSDNRIGTGYNNPSFGYGGYCLPKDTQQLRSDIKQLSLSLPVIDAITNSNNMRLNYFIENVLKSAPETVGIYRMQMKQGSDNARSSANLQIYRTLKSSGNCKLIVYEPYIEDNSDWLEDRTSSLSNFFETATIILANRWNDELLPVASKVICRDIYHEN